MSFFQNLFHKNVKGESVILIDIGAESIAGAYARYEENTSPTLLYTKCIPIEMRVSESREVAMLRALHALGTTCIREGAPMLTRATGRGSADMILVSIDAPWQETAVHTEFFESKDPFVFTKESIDRRLEETNTASSEKMIVDESIIGTILNGYETHSPYGKEVSRASVVVLTSFIPRTVASNIISELRSLFHTANIMPIAGSSLRYQAMRALFPHESEAIILDATGGSLVSIALIRKRIFNTLVQIKIEPEKQSWIEAVTHELAEMAKLHPLPRTIFLLAREPEIFSLHKELETANLNSLWLSATPPKIVPILRNHVSGSIRHMTANPTDTILLLMTLYFQNKRSFPDNIA